MKLIQLISLLTLVLATGCSREQKSKDFDAVCEYFNQLQSQLDQQVMTPAERRGFILDKVSANLPENSNARVAWEAITNGPASERYPLFVEAAASTDVRNWQCPAMQQLASTLE